MLLLLASGALADATVVTLRADAESTGKYIRLDEIAEIRGEYAEDLAGVFIGPAPQKQQELVLNREEILRCLRMRGLDAGVNLAGSETVRVLGVEAPEAVAVPAPLLSVETTETIRQVAGEVEASGIAAAVVKPVKAEVKLSPRELANTDEARALLNHAVTAYLIQSLHIRDPKLVDIATSASRCSFSTPAASVEIEALQSGTLPGRAMATLILRDKSGKAIGTGSANLSVGMMVTVPVVMRNLKQNEDLKPGDVVLRKLRFKEGMPVNPLDPADLEGLASLQNLRAGSIPLAGDFGPGLDIRKGQVLTVSASTSAFSISEQATAESDGRRGDTILVESVLGKKTYRARITGPDRAEIPQQSPIVAR